MFIIKALLFLICQLSNMNFKLCLIVLNSYLVFFIGSCQSSHKNRPEFTFGQEVKSIHYKLDTIGNIFFKIPDIQSCFNSSINKIKNDYKMKYYEKDACKVDINFNVSSFNDSFISYQVYATTLICPDLPHDALSVAFYNIYISEGVFYNVLIDSTKYKRLSKNNNCELGDLDNDIYVGLVYDKHTPVVQYINRFCDFKDTIDESKVRILHQTFE